MIIKQELIKKIRSHFNLNIYEAKVWLALLSRGISTAGEIAEISGVPRSRTYDVLESLEKQGFAIEKIGKPVKYIAVEPSLVIEKLKNEVAKEAKERCEILDKLKTTSEYEELELLHRLGIEPVKSVELSGAIKGKINISSQLHNMIENSKKSVILATTSSAIDHDLRIIKQLVSKLKKNNVRIKISVNSDIQKLEKLKKELGVDIKQLDLNARFCIIDGKKILFMVNDVIENGIGIWINSEFFSSALEGLFESVWNTK